MRKIAFIAFGAILWQAAAQAQTAVTDPPPVEDPDPGKGATSSVDTTIPVPAQEFVPMTASERMRLYLEGAFGLTAIARALAVGGVEQWTATPKEWGGGAEAYGYRIGNAFAEHVIREALEYGGSAALHEDNRYIRSTQTGFLKRSKHAITSVFVAHDEAGGEHFAYSRFGAVLGSSFISRLWQPRSEDSSGAAAVYFGLNIAGDIGWNFFDEFAHRHSPRN
jgi:hypothetical protein